MINSSQYKILDDKYDNLIDKYFEKRHKMLFELEERKNSFQNAINIGLKVEKYQALLDDCINKINYLNSIKDTVIETVIVYKYLLIEMQMCRPVVKKAGRFSDFDYIINVLKKRMLRYILDQTDTVEDYFNDAINMIFSGFNVQCHVGLEIRTAFKEKTDEEIYKIRMNGNNDIATEIKIINYKWNEVKKYMKNNYEEYGKEDGKHCDF